jgi:hypothetical protein
VGWCPDDFLLHSHTHPLSFSLSPSFWRAVQTMATLLFNCSCAVTTFVVYNEQLRKKAMHTHTHTQQLENRSCYCYDNKRCYTHICTYILTRKKSYGLLVERKTMMTETWSNETIQTSFIEFNWTIMKTEEKVHCLDIYIQSWKSTNELCRYMSIFKCEYINVWQIRLYDTNECTG